MPEDRRPTSLKPQWFHIPLSLADQDLRGLQIKEEVSDRTGGEIHLWPGALYGSLRILLEKGLVEEVEEPADARAGGGRPRYYGITESGRAAVVEEARRLSGYRPWPERRICSPRGGVEGQCASASLRFP